MVCALTIPTRQRLFSAWGIRRRPGVFQLMRKQMVLRGGTLLSLELELVLREVERRGTQGLRESPPLSHVNLLYVSGAYTVGDGLADERTLLHNKLVALHSGANHGGTGGPTYTAIARCFLADRGKFAGRKLETGAPLEGMQATARASHKRAGAAAALRPFPSMSATERGYHHEKVKVGCSQGENDQLPFLAEFETPFKAGGG